MRWRGVRIDQMCRLATVEVAGRAGITRRGFIADDAISRAIGMLGTPDPGDDEVLILAPCTAVHGIGLRCRIGVAFVDPHGVVLRVVDPLPWWGARATGAHAVIEARSGVLASLRPGDTVRVDDTNVFPLVGNSALR